MIDTFLFLTSGAIWIISYISADLKDSFKLLAISPQILIFFLRMSAKEFQALLRFHSDPTLLLVQYTAFQSRFPTETLCLQCLQRKRHSPFTSAPLTTPSHAATRLRMNVQFFSTTACPSQFRSQLPFSSFPVQNRLHRRITPFWHGDSHTIEQWFCVFFIFSFRFVCFVFTARCPPATMPPVQITNQPH